LFVIKLSSETGHHPKPFLWLRYCFPGYLVRRSFAFRIRSYCRFFGNGNKPGLKFIGNHQSMYFLCQKLENVWMVISSVVLVFADQLESVNVSFPKILIMRLKAIWLPSLAFSNKLGKVVLRFCPDEVFIKCNQGGYCVMRIFFAFLCSVGSLPNSHMLHHLYLKWALTGRMSLQISFLFSEFFSFFRPYFLLRYRQKPVRVGPIVKK